MRPRHGLRGVGVLGQSREAVVVLVRVVAVAGYVPVVGMWVVAVSLLQSRGGVGKEIDIAC